MDHQQTCGKGLAEHSLLPARMGAALDAMAGNLEAHMKALDLADAGAREEHAAYTELARDQHELAERLFAMAARMRAYRDLPMARHDLGVMSGPDPMHAFERFVKAEQELAITLQDLFARHQAMLAEWRGG